MIAQLTRLGVIVGTRDEQEHARAAFANSHCMLIPGFLAPDLVEWFQRRIADAPFETRVHDLVTPPSVDLAMASHPIASRLHFLVNDSRLFTLIERVTGCDSIGCFRGTVYKMAPGDGHCDSWHHDVDGNRMLTLSVNLSERCYCGGLLQIMDWERQQLVCEVANVGPGDALVFPLSMRWRHRVTQVTGDAAKVAFAGWFERQPRYADCLSNVASG